MVNIIILFILFIGNIIINNDKYYFLLIYSFLLLFNIYIIHSIIKYGLNNKNEILRLLFVSLLSYLFSYFMIYDSNPLICIITYYIFFPNFIKAILIVIFHTYFFTRYPLILNYDYINNNFDKELKKIYFHKRKVNYFLSDAIKYCKKNKHRYIFIILLILFLSINIIIFINRIKIWVYFNNKEKTLPISSSKNTTFYITAMIVDMEGIIVNFIEQMKKLISIIKVLMIFIKKAQLCLYYLI